MEKVTITFTTWDYDSQVYGERIDRSFEAVDTKGRQFGATVRPFEIDLVRRTADVWASCAGNFSQEEAGHRWGFAPHATRGGKLYGASQGSRLFTSKEDRDAAIEKYFTTAEKGALKNKARAC